MMRESEDEDTLLEDTLSKLRTILNDLMAAEYMEHGIAKELRDVVSNFDDEKASDNFFSQMVWESSKRSRLLLLYRLRAESLFDRLKVWERTSEAVNDNKQPAGWVG